MAKDQTAPDNGKMKRKDYEKELRKLQVELCHLQEWVKAEGSRIIVVFEGRDAAGKGGTIKAITERVSPRVFRVVALPAPSDREKTQMFLQRYIAHFPAAGEMAAELPWLWPDAQSLLAVGQPHFCHFAQRRVRLLRCARHHLDAHAAPLWAIGQRR